MGITSKLAIMQPTLLPLLAILLFSQYHPTQSKTLEKRYSNCYGGNCGLEPIRTCPGGRCGGGGGGCSNGRCPIIEPPQPQPCSGGRCGGGCSGGNCPIIEPPIQPCPGGSCGGGCRGGNCPIIDPPVQPCSGGRCGSSCSGGNCPIVDPPVIQSPCSGGRCGGGRIQTCSSCVNRCASRCSNNQCLNSCLNDCSCDGRIVIPEPEPEIETENNNCCDVLHPKHCFTEENGNRRCVVRKHRECSDLCSSSVVSIQEGGSRTGCHYVQNYPYAYCGNYERHDCGQCYSCDGSNNPGTCSQRSECSQSCRNIIRG